MYKACLISPDGDYVFDYEGETIEEVLRKLSNRGSEWFFFPFEVIVRDRVVVDDPLGDFEGVKVEDLAGAFAEASTHCNDLFELYEAVAAMVALRR